MSHPLTRFAPALIVAGLVLTPAPRAQWDQQSLSVARQAVGAAGFDGRVWIAGGRVGNTPQDAVDVFEPATGTWAQLTLSVARTGLAVAGVDHWVLFAGGRTSTATTTGVVDIYDTLDGSWSTHVLASPREQIGVTVVGGKVFLAGGSSGSIFAPTASDVVDIYDSALGDPDDPGAWSTKTLDVARASIAATTVGDQALFAGGIETDGSVVADVDIYDAGDDEWTSASLSQARKINTSGAASTATRAYFAGGNLSPAVLSDVVDVYDVTTGAWSTEAIELPRAAHTVSAVGGRLLVAGGFLDTGAATGRVEVFDEALGDWRPSTQLSAPRGNLTGAAVDGVAVFAAGFGSEVSAVVDRYDPTWSDEGSALAGAGGEPRLNGQGSLEAGSANEVSLSQAASNAIAGLFLATSSTPVPFKGGTLKPFPFLDPVIVPTTSAGAIDVPFVMPGGVPAGTELWIQWAVQDAGAVSGVALSNAILGLTP